MNTIRPRRIRIMSSTAAKSSSLISASSWSRVIPALATSTSTGPCAASAAANASSTAAASRTSHRATASPSPAPSSSPEREVIMTLSPPAASRRAMARPMPRFPPVTRTDRLISGPPQVWMGDQMHRIDWPVVRDRADQASAPIDPEFTAYPLRQLADAALQRAADLGAEHADFRAEQIRGQQIRLSDGNLETLFDSDDLGLAVRVVVAGTWGFASAIDLTPDAAARAAAEAVEVARVAAAINTERIELAPEPAHGEVSWVSDYHVVLFSVSVTEKIGLLADWSSGLLAR